MGERKVSTQESRIQLVDGDIVNCPPPNRDSHTALADCPMEAGRLTLFEEFSGGQKLFAYYLITKESADLKSMCTSFEAMKKHCIVHGITKVSMPKNECGLENLN
uniref:Uncharacterized protein n=1 Tax=Eptatretus burgeri TaxID=7764 RepID=A0A8C4WWR2_EPTBU